MHAETTTLRQAKCLNAKSPEHIAHATTSVLAFATVHRTSAEDGVGSICAVCFIKRHDTSNVLLSYYYAVVIGCPLPDIVDRAVLDAIKDDFGIVKPHNVHKPNMKGDLVSHCVDCGSQTIVRFSRLTSYRLFWVHWEEFECAECSWQRCAFLQGVTDHDSSLPPLLFPHCIWLSKYRLDSGVGGWTGKCKILFWKCQLSIYRFNLYKYKSLHRRIIITNTAPAMRCVPIVLWKLLTIRAAVLLRTAKCT